MFSELHCNHLQKLFIPSTHSYSLGWGRLRKSPWLVEALLTRILPSKIPYCFPSILDQQHELERVNWSRFKTESLIEPTCLIILCMNKNCSNPSVLRNLKSPEDSVFEETFTDVLSLIPKIHSDPSEYHYWYSMTCQAFSYP